MDDCKSKRLLSGQIASADNQPASQHSRCNLPDLLKCNLPAEPCGPVFKMFERPLAIRTPVLSIQSPSSDHGLHDVNCCSVLSSRFWCPLVSACKHTWQSSKILVYGHVQVPCSQPDQIRCAVTQKIAASHLSQQTCLACANGTRTSTGLNSPRLATSRQFGPSMSAASEPRMLHCFRRRLKTMSCWSCGMTAILLLSSAGRMASLNSSWFLGPLARDVPASS